MERMIYFEQFYYTNYGQGMRFEGNSTEQARIASDLELLASNWMKQDLNEPVELVLYNSHLGCYVSAMSEPCTQAGDARTSYWIHAVMPDVKENDGFMACLSWPTQDYVTKVQLGQKLTAAAVKTVPYDLRDICQKYHLTGRRLQHLLYMVWQTVGNESAPSCLCLTMGDNENNYNTAAREIMAVVYHLLPKPYRKMADYRSKAGKDMDDVRFYFRASSQQSWQFAVDGTRQWDVLELPEEEMGFLAHMAKLFERNPDEYEQLLDQLCQQESEDYEAMLWNYYQISLENGGQLPFSQETLLRIQPFLEEKMKHDGRKRALFCQCLHQIDISDKERPFVQLLLDKYIAAAAGLSDSEARFRDQSFEKSWQLLDQLSEGKIKVVADYLTWMKDISVQYYQAFVQYGSREGRDWLMDLQFANEGQLSCRELLAMNVDQMNAQRGYLWVKIMAQCIQKNMKFQNSAETAAEVWHYLIRLVEVMVPEAEGEKEKDAVLETTIQMQYLLQYIWKYRLELDVKERVEICGVAKLYGGSVFDIFSRDFWQEIQAEDFEKLYEKKGSIQLFSQSPYAVYHHYRFYVGYRHREEKKDRTPLSSKEIKALKKHLAKNEGEVVLAADAIWLYWQNHPDADDQIFMDYLSCLLSKNTFDFRLNKYSTKDYEAYRRADKIHRLMLPDHLEVQSGKVLDKDDVQTEKAIMKAYTDIEKSAMEKLSGYSAWFLAGGVGFLLGLVLAWFAGYGIITLSAVILAIILMAAAGWIYFKYKN